MNDGLVTATIVVALVVAAWFAVVAYRRRPPNKVQLLVGLGAVELIILVDVVVAIVAMIGGERPGETATFIGYLIATPLLPVLVALWAWFEPTHWSSWVIVAGCLVTVVLAVRLQQIWTAPGG